MSGDLPIRKARTKREKNKSYNDSRNKFRASLKPERTDSSPSEEDDKVKEKKMKVDGQCEGIAQSIQNTSENKEKQFKVVEEVDQKMADKLIETKENSSVTKEQKDSKDEQYNKIETGEVKYSEKIDKAETSKKVKVNHNEAQGSSDPYIMEEKKSAANKERTNEDHGSDEFATWDYMLESDEDGKAIHSKDSKKYVKVVISTPTAKTTSEEENTDDEEKDEDSDANEKISNKNNKDNKDKDNDESGGGTSTFKGEKEGDGSGDAGGSNAGGKYGDNMMNAEDNLGGASGDANDCVDGDRNNETEDDEDPPDDKDIEKGDEQSADEQMEGDDFSTGEFNFEGAVDPYDVSEDDADEISSNYYDRYEFLSGGGSDLDTDFSNDGDFYDEIHYGDEFHDEAPTTEVRGAG